MKNVVNLAIRIAVVALFVFTVINVLENSQSLNLTYIYFYIALVIISLVSDKFFYTGQKTENKREKYDLTSHILALTWFSTLTLPVLEYSIFQRNNLIVSIFGVLLVIFGTIIRGIGIKTLGNFFSRDVETWDNQAIVQTGIYKYIRHPAYTGNILQIIGFPLVLNAYLSLLMSFVTILVFLWRIKVEEAFLVERFPDYEEYMMHTKKLIPKIW
jgi:protein-S-isoprenylcysteine O-methyltransferase Ste14